MADWLPFLLTFLVTFLVDVATIAFFARRAYDKGYEAGMTDALELSDQIDEVLRGGGRGYPNPTAPARHPSIFHQRFLALCPRSLPSCLCAPSACCSC